MPRRQWLVHDQELRISHADIQRGERTMTAANLRQVGDILKDRFDAAAEVRLIHSTDGQRAELQRRHVAFKEPTEADLVYSETSPDYCHQRVPGGSRFATSGRR